MSARFTELAFSDTAIGEISLRRRLEPVTGQEIYEVKLGDEFLMSSLFTKAEEELARLCLDRLATAFPGESSCSVVVGGLGLGYTAVAALQDSKVEHLVVVELLQPVIDWHRDGLVPHGAVLTADPRCRLVQGDFFAMSGGDGFDPVQPGRLFDAVLLDIDHSPSHALAAGNDGFYGPHGTRDLAKHLRPGGVYGMWSNDPPDQGYLDILAGVFADVTADVITFPNPLQNREATATVYLATAPE